MLMLAVYVTPVACVVIAAAICGYREFRAAHKANGGME